MSEELVVKNFRNKPVDIEVGDSDKDGKRLRLTIRDIKYNEHTKFKQVMSNLWMKAQAAPQTAKYFDELVRQQVAKGISIEDTINSIVGSVTEVYKSINEDDKVELLEILTEGQINKKNIKILQACEVYNLLSWLIERNMSAEKNFEASLNFILNPNNSNQDIQK